MASNIFNDANGTTLAAKDPKWIGNTTLLEMQGGELQVTNASLFNDRFVAYSDGQPNAHESEVELAAGCSFAGGEILEVTCQYTSASVLYSARVGTTDVVLRRNGSYVDASAHGMNLAVPGNKVRIACNPTTGSVQIYINNTLLGIAPYTDGSPLTGGLPGFYINVQGNAANTIRLLSWSDGIAGGAPALDSRGSLRPTRVPQRRPGRGPYSMGTYRRPSLDVFGPLVQPLFGEAVGQGSAAGSLDHGVPLAGTAQGGAAATGTLSHGVPLAGAAQGGATAAGVLDHGVPLAGAAQGGAAAVGAVDHGVPLTGAAQGGAAVAGALEISLPPPDPLFGSRRNRPGRGPYSKGRYFRPALHAFINTNVSLGAAASGQVSASGALAVGVTLLAAAVGASVVNGGLAHAVPLQGTVAAMATGTGGLTLSIALSATAIAAALVSGALDVTSGVSLAAAPQGQGTGTGALNVGKPLAVAAQAQGNANASLTLLVQLSAAAIGRALSTAALDVTAGGVVTLAGAGQGSGSGTGSVSVGKPMAGSAQGGGQAGATLSLTVPLSLAAIAQAQVGGTLSINVLLSTAALASAAAIAGLQVTQAGLQANAQGRGLASGSLSVPVRLSGSAGSQTLASGSLSLGEVTTAERRRRVPGHALIRAVPA